MSRYSMSEPWNDRLEIAGDAREDAMAEMEREEGYEACPVPETTDEDMEGHFSQWSDEHPEDMDGDHETALRDAGFGTDEDYGYFGGEDAFLDGSYEE
jgi:hypothetical protein